MIHSMPSEILRLIINGLWGSDLRACLGVNRIFHACAAARIFSSVHIRFGLQGAPEILNNRSDHSWETCVQWLEVETEAIMQSCALLSAIEQWPTLTQAIRKLTVHAKYGRDTAVFQRRKYSLMTYIFLKLLNSDIRWLDALIRAIKHLPHLVEFNWIGSSPAIQGDILQALGDFCPSLRNLTYQ